MVKKLTPINQISLHYKRPHISKLPKLTYTSDVVDYLFQIIDNNTIDLREHCWLALITSNDHLLGISEIHLSSIREIIQFSLVANAVKIVVIQGRPSGNKQPLELDFKMIKELSHATRLLQIVLADYIILTSESYTSTRRENII